ncbi:MAG: phospholipid carrier-dependent glycosyltransferase [Fimbriimonadaceae bacterium]|nr:phospholipid carrier-dependent glycosyltransferase [Fimbriimonadaceae bacterium]
MLAWFQRLDPKLTRWGLALFVGALVFRLIGIDWGLPSADRYTSLHPDEDLNIAVSQQVNPAAGKFTTGFYNYPTFYLTLARVGAMVADGYAPPGEVKTPAAAAAVRARHILVGRWVSALAGAGAVFVVFALLYRRVHDLAALAGALAVAVAPGHVVHSRFATVDVLGAFFVVLSLYWAARMLPPDGGTPDGKALMRHALYAGVCAGLAAGTKYNGALALVGLAVPVVVWARGGQGWGWAAKTFGAALAAAVAVFFVTTPGALLEPQAFQRDFSFELSHTSQGHGLVFAGTSSGFGYHLANLFLGFGFLLTVLGAGGLVWGCVRKHAWLGVLLVFAVVYYLLIGRAEVKFFRYVLPLVPVLAVGVGWVFDRFHTNPETRWRTANLLPILGLAGIAGGGLNAAATWTSWMASPDPRDVVGKELKEKGGTLGLVSDAWFYTPTLFPEVSLSRGVSFQKRLDFQQAVESPRILQFVPDNPTARKPWDARLVTELKPDRIVYSSFERDNLDRLTDLKAVPSAFQSQVDDYKEFVRALTQDYVEEQVFAPGGPSVEDLMYIRPTLYVWKRKTLIEGNPAASSTTSSSSAAPAGTP